MLATNVMSTKFGVLKICIYVRFKDVEYRSSSDNPLPLLSAKEAVSLWVLGARKVTSDDLVAVAT